MSRSWALLHRKRDQAFDAACGEALAAARARLARAGEPRPPSGWDFLDGEELVVKGTGGSGGGKRVQIAQARLKQWTPRVEQRFLAVPAATCNVRAACSAVGMWPPSAYRHRKRWAAFEERWKQAVEIGYEQLDLGLIERGCNLFSPDEFPIDQPMRR